MRNLAAQAAAASTGALRLLGRFLFWEQHGYARYQGQYVRLLCRRLGGPRCILVFPSLYDVSGNPREAISILLDSWDGAPDSLRSEIVMAMCRFVDLYYGEYDRKRLIRRCRRFDPLTIYRKGQAVGDGLPGYKKYLYQILDIYNGSGKKDTLPFKV